MQSPNYENEGIKNDNFFRCEICVVWFNDIDDFFLHILEEHQHIEISNDMQDILYKQWEKILKMEKTIMELVSKNKFKSAKRHLKSSLITLNGIISNVFSTNDNIFKYFVSSMRPRIKLLIKEAKLENDNLKTNDEKVSKRTNAEKFHDVTKKQRLKKKKKKSLKTDENGSNQTSDFSSDDNLCLKDAIKQIKKDSSLECKSVKTESQDDCIKKITYYVVPEKKDKKALSVLEKDQIRVALKHILKKKFVDLNLFDGFVLKRFELEFDEVVPEDAIIVTEWLFDDGEKKDWDSTSFADFLSKNVSKKRKTSDFDCENGSSSLKGADRSFECGICNSKFSTNSFLKIHMINIHHTSDFSCDTCGEIFLNKGKLFQHQLQCHSSNLECEVCLVRCSSNVEKEKHFLLHEPDGWCCGICSQNFLLAEDLKNHYRTLHSDRNVEERIGEDSKVSMKAIKFDKRSDNAPKCDRCFRRFTSIGRLTQHIAIAHEGKIFRKEKQKIDESVVLEQSSS